MRGGSYLPLVIYRKVLILKDLRMDCYCKVFKIKGLYVKVFKTNGLGDVSMFRD
jgi:hypothetical protein